MKKIASVAQMRECDRVTIEDLGVPGILLMETAARAVTAKAVELLDDDPAGKRVLVFAGKGNNGGDGFASARHLHSLGARVTVIQVGEVDSLKGDARFNADLYSKADGVIREVTDSMKSLDGIIPPAGKIDLIIDALLGTGFKGVAKGLYKVAINLINSIDAPVVAVDIPSGVVGDTGVVSGSAVRADETVTFGLCKAGLMFPAGREYAGRVSVADIGIPKSVVDAQNIGLFVVGEDDVRPLVPRRNPAAHKGDIGHVYILAGSPGLTGAAALAAEASMRCGTGLTVVGVPVSLNVILETKLTEAMTQPLPENQDGFLTNLAFNDILPRLSWADAVAVGPGLGRHAETAELFGRIIEAVTKPLIIDADGLNILADHPELLDALPENTVLTPHPGEFARLIRSTAADILSDRVRITRRWADKWGVTLMLKGAPSITAVPGGDVFINSTGNAGMASGGSGDVLTGIIASLAAQDMGAGEAAWVGAYLHGAAGDIAADEIGQHGMVAGDIIDCLPEVIKELE